MADSSNSQMDPVLKLRIARHQQFCLALPFPRLDWTSPEATRKSLDELHDYALQLGNSGLDWYLCKKKVKKVFAKVLHWSIYGAGVIAAAFPLLKLSNVLNINLFAKCCGSETSFNSLAAEMSLALIGVAAGLALIDKTAGISNDWMRYIRSAAQINSSLIEFNFKWDALEQTLPYPPKDLGAHQAPVEAAQAATSTPQERAPASPNDPIAARIDLVRDFCREIIKVTSDETNEWAKNLEKQIDHHAQRGGKG